MLTCIKKFVVLSFLCCVQMCSAYDALAGHQQAIVVTTRDWNEIQGTLQMFERSDDTSAWRAVGPSMPIVVGQAGLAWGIGLHLAQNMPPVKKEGDKKAPAGIFSLGTAFGFAPPSKMQSLRIEYLQLDATTECVDDSKSTHYNCIVNSQHVRPDWDSSEKMGFIPLYERGFVINHNFPNPKPMCGSAIFFHIWRRNNSGTAGCTATTAENVSCILSWLDRTKDPVLVQLPSAVYNSLLSSWSLPAL
jgi:D-alanyl-D-alanine dipeptidase